jgi:hypothetical protein
MTLKCSRIVVQNFFFVCGPFLSFNHFCAPLILFNYNKYNICNKYVVYQHGYLCESVSMPLNISQANWSIGTNNF